MKRLTPYEAAVRSFKGVRRLAAALGFESHSTVTRWKDRGYIPAHHMKAVLRAAEERGIKTLKPEHLIFGADPSEFDDEEDGGRNAPKIAA